MVCNMAKLPMFFREACRAWLKTENCTQKLSFSVTPLLKFLGGPLLTFIFVTVSSFLLFEDMTIDKNLNFAWHLDMVTKNLKPFILTVVDKNKFQMPEKYDCISKNFWF